MTEQDTIAEQPSPAQGVPDWERRFRAPRVGLPDWARDAPERAAVVASVDGVLEVHSWDRTSKALVQATRRKEGTASATIDPAGEFLWWFDDQDGDEYGVWRRQPFGSEPDTDAEDPIGLPAAYPSGLAIGRDGVVVVGRSDDDFGAQIHVITSDAPPRLLYAHQEDAGVGDLSEDGELVAIFHSEHGDSRHPALRVVRTATGEAIAELWDGPGKGVEAFGFAPREGDARLLVGHERRGRPELLVWDVTTGEQRELTIDVEGEISDADWFLDAEALLLGVDHEARTRLYRFDLATERLTALGRPDGSVRAATPRPDGDVWMVWSSAAEPPSVRDLAGDVVLEAPGDPGPGSVPIEDVWVEGPGGRVHALLRRPPGAAGPLPMVVDVHGGPTHHDADVFRASPAAWVDHGVAVVQVNYRGSTGYGSAWRDAIERRIGHVELEDVVAVVDHLVASGVADADRVVLAGGSWGGFLTLLGLGLYPDRWALGLAAVPVADYVAAYEDEMEGLKAFDRSLFGGSPEEVPDKYRDSSPLTYVDAVRAPALILAGENDPRCPIRQIENYLAELERRGVPHEVYRYDAGHGSLVDEEVIRQVRAELDFARRHLPGGLPG
jgi:dipeptidyl aminopeptidase/acylaminoacyl peptidase